MMNKILGLRASFKISIFCFILIFFFTYPLLAARRKSSPKKISCKTAILSDSTKVKRLYGKSVHTKVLPASTTKVMTALVVLERLKLNRYVKVGAHALAVSPSKINLRTGEEYKVSDLLYAMLLSSANDASVALAEAVSGSEWEFVKLMNKKAKEIGARHTKFANSHGLPSGKEAQYTTAYDMYLIFREALKNNFFKQAIKYKYMAIYSKDRRKIGLKSHNKMLFGDWKKKIYGKTGYTHAAQGCFVGAMNHNGSTYIVGVFGCTNRWDYIKRIVEKHVKVDL